MLRDWLDSAEGAWRGRWFLALVVPAFLAAACYEAPKVPLDRPLPCTPSEPECPIGYACVGERICAPLACINDSDCPTGLVCTGSKGCNLPSKATNDGATDDGAVGSTADGGGPDGVLPLDAAGSPDAATADAAAVDSFVGSADAPGGG